MYEFLGERIERDGIEIHFSGYRAALLDALQAARKSIRITTYISAFSFKRPGNPVNDIITVLEEKKKRGLDVRFILDGPKKGAANFRPALIFSQFLAHKGFKAAVQYGKPTLHMKVVLVDLERVFIGSHNLTRSSIQNPLDCSAEIESIVLAVHLADKFDQLFEVLKHG